MATKIEQVELNLLQPGVLEGLVAEERIPTFSYEVLVGSPFSPQRRTEYWAIIPPRKLEAGDVSKRIDGTWWLKSATGQMESYGYTALSFGQKEIIKRQILILQQAQDRKTTT